MMTIADLPEPIETPHAAGDLSDEEEQILALCMRGVRQFEEAWWVMGKAMANINSRRLYRKTHASFEDSARDTFNKSRPLAYEEMTSYKIGELLSARADKVFESESNDLSVRADTPPSARRPPAPSTRSPRTTAPKRRSPSTRPSRTPLATPSRSRPSPASCSSFHAGKRRR